MRVFNLWTILDSGDTLNWGALEVVAMALVTIL